MIPRLILLVFIVIVAFITKEVLGGLAQYGLGYLPVAFQDMLNPNTNLSRGLIALEIGIVLGMWKRTRRWFTDSLRDLWREVREWISEYFS